MFNKILYRMCVLFFLSGDCSCTHPHWWQSSHLPKYTKKKMTYSTVKNTGIDSLINIQGYFRKGEREFTIDDNQGENYPDGEIKLLNDTSYSNLMFYKDGSFVYGFFDYNNNIPEYFRQIVHDSKEGKKNLFYNAFYWGYYVINGDTIKAQCVNKPSLTAPWDAFEVWYKVTDKNTLIEIKLLSLNKVNKIESKRSNFAAENRVKYSFPATFIPVEVKPDSNSWLNRRK